MKFLSSFATVTAALVAAANLGVVRAQESIPDTLAARNDTTPLLLAVEAANLTDVLSGDGPFSK